MAVTAIEAEEIGIGWQVYEPVPFDANHEPRGGIVIETIDASDSDGEYRILKVAKMFHGQLKVVELEDRDIDLATACRPSEVQPFVIGALIKHICGLVHRDKGRKFSDYHQWLVRVAYKLSTLT